MKTLLLVRHAKAQPDAPAGDRARALTTRGLRYAAAMGAYLHALAGTPDAIITSDARRARQTAEILARAVGFTLPLAVEPRLYGAEVATLLALVRSVPEAANAAVLVGHNPGFEALAAVLADTHPADVRLPTAGLAVLEFAVNRWDAVQTGTGRLRHVATPRTIA